MYTPSNVYIYVHIYTCFSFSAYFLRRNPVSQCVFQLKSQHGSYVDIRSYSVTRTAALSRFKKTQHGSGACLIHTCDHGVSAGENWWGGTAMRTAAAATAVSKLKPRASVRCRSHEATGHTSGVRLATDELEIVQHSVRSGSGRNQDAAAMRSIRTWTRELSRATRVRRGCWSTRVTLRVGSHGATAGRVRAKNRRTAVCSAAGTLFFCGSPETREQPSMSSRCYFAGTAR